jgi:hypothetical protein
MNGEYINTSDKWELHSGCHRGTLMSRDSGVENCDSLEHCRQRVADAEKFYRSIGYYVWFAYAIPPGKPMSEQVRLHSGTSYY